MDTQFTNKGELSTLRGVVVGCNYHEFKKRYKNGTKSFLQGGGAMGRGNGSEKLGSAGQRFGGAFLEGGQGESQRCR